MLRKELGVADIKMFLMACCLAVPILISGVWLSGIWLLASGFCPCG